MHDQRALQSPLTITTYEEFTHFLRQFVAGLIRFLLIIGGPGIAKSRSVRSAIGNRAHLDLETHATAFGMCHELYKHCGLPVIIDDLDHIYCDRASQEPVQHGPGQETALAEPASRYRQGRRAGVLRNDIAGLSHRQRVADDKSERAGRRGSGDHDPLHAQRRRGARKGPRVVQRRGGL